MTPIAHNKPWITRDDVAAVDALLETRWLAPGPETAALEQDFVALHGGGGACAVSSGSAALFVALKALGIGPGHLIAIPTYVCTAVLNAIALCGAEPVLADIDGERFNIDPAAMAAMARKPDAAIAVHTYGAAADVAALQRLCPVVVEDCAQAIGGVDSEDRPLGTTGTVAIHSFYATKIVTSGHGGMVYARDGKAAAAARDYVLFDGRESWKPRFNFQTTDFQAALARRQLARLDAIAARRRAIAAAYRAALPAGYTLQAGIHGPRDMPYRFVVRTPDERVRDALKAHFASRDIGVIVPLETLELLHRYLGMPASAFPTAERVAATTLSLPLYPALRDDEARRVADALAEAPKP
ncbi:MAG: hypothetical protein FJX36_11300 [Alphaproteobacteria bacterium]|nr:hypothetical protein [Alphaproteobacteria bacterium]